MIWICIILILHMFIEKDTWYMCVDIFLVETSFAWQFKNNQPKYIIKTCWTNLNVFRCKITCVWLYKIFLGKDICDICVDIFLVRSSFAWQVLWTRLIKCKSFWLTYKCNLTSWDWAGPSSTIAVAAAVHKFGIHYNCALHWLRLGLKCFLGS